MNVDFIKIFNSPKKMNLKWKENIKFENKIIFKNSLVENACKYPLTDSIRNEVNSKTWKNILGIEDISINNINNLLARYDTVTKEIINSKDKTGYAFNELNILVLFKDKLVTVIEGEEDNINIVKTFLNFQEMELIPIFYNLNYNFYNLFSVNKSGAMTYFDETLKKQINDILDSKSIKQTLINYSQDKSNRTKTLINNFYKGKESKEDLEKLVKFYEFKLDELVKYRNVYQKEINISQKKVDEIKTNKMQKITKMQKLEYLLEEAKKIDLIIDEKTKEKAIKKMIKNNKDVFDNIEKTSIIDFIEKEINNEYMELYISPSEYKDNIKTLHNKMKRDIISSYLVAVYYYLLMISIRLSGNKLSSKYEGNLIKKAIFNIDELEDFIDIINKNLLK